MPLHVGHVYSRNVYIPDERIGLRSGEAWKILFPPRLLCVPSPHHANPRLPALGLVLNDSRSLTDAPDNPLRPPSPKFHRRRQVYGAFNLAYVRQTTPLPLS